MGAVTTRAASAVSFQQTRTVPRSGSRVVEGAISKGLPQPGSSLVDVILVWRERRHYAVIVFLPVGSRVGTITLLTQ